jgi:hypothetical protein
MAQVDSEHSTAMPALPAGSLIPSGLAKQQRDREKALRRVAKLRQKAADEIERLLAFLDASDPYASTELEDGIDDGPIDDNELDGPENGEDEECAPREWSLGSFDGQTDQSGWSAGRRADLEIDGAESGIADQDGLDEQVPFRDWQNGGDGLMSEHTLITPRRNFLIRALGFTAAGATMSIPIVTLADAKTADTTLSTSFMLILSLLRHPQPMTSSPAAQWRGLSPHCLGPQSTGTRLVRRCGTGLEVLGDDAARDLLP